MELNIGIKEEQEEFLKQTMNEYSKDGIEKIIQVLSKEIIEKFDKKIVFGEIRCVGSCFSNDKFIKVELDDDLISKMKDIFKISRGKQSCPDAILWIFDIFKQFFKRIFLD